MKKIQGLFISAFILLATGCGAQPAAAPVVGTSNATATSNGASNRADSTNASTPPQLSATVIGSANVLVPDGWTKTDLSGGDWMGIKYVNPSDQNQVEIVTSSSCVGCASNQKLFAKGEVKPDPTAVVHSAEGMKVSSDGWSASYRVTDTKNSTYTGQGAVTVTKDPSGSVAGYIEVQVFLPGTEQSLATQITGSLQQSN